ncbi:arginine deiminase family protein, partial [Aminipila sp.]
MFKNCIVRRPCKAMVEGITSAPELGKPNYELALKQHDTYIEALKQCGVQVTVLDALEQYPDSCFVEDPAVITSKCAIITNPGAGSRNGEKAEILSAVKKFFRDDQIEYITAPGTLEGGDVMMVGDHFYVGRSARTNEEGIRQFIEILEKHGLTGSEVPLEKV